MILSENFIKSDSFRSKRHLFKRNIKNYCLILTSVSLLNCSWEESLRTLIKNFMLVVKFSSKLDMFALVYSYLCRSNIIKVIVMLLRLLKNWTLPVAMLSGTLCYFLLAYIPLFAPAKPTIGKLITYATPTLIFLQLFLLFEVLEKFHLLYICSHRKLLGNMHN